MYCRMFYCALLACCAHAWDLNNVTTRGATVRGVAVWRTRAFLCLSRETGAGGATLVEAPWPEPTDNVVSLKRHLEPPGSVGTSAYPNLDSQREGNCSCIQSVAALDIDPIGRLWVLDEGGRCPPKLVVLDLWRDKEVTRCDLPSIEGREMRSLAVDTLSGWGARAYIGDPGGNRLMIFSIRDQRYWFARLQLRQHNGILTDGNPPEIVSTEVSSFDLALSRKDPTLYLTSRKSELLFSVDLTHLRANLAPNVGQEAILDVQYLGRKLGLSVGLTTDYKGGLHYFLPRDNVAVRWDTQIPLAAESHTITLQSAELLPSVSQLFVDQQRQVWAVTNHNGSKQHSVLLQTYRQRTHFCQ